MRGYVIAIMIAATAAVASFLTAASIGRSMSTRLDCIEASSTGSFACTDPGNFESTCATATCPAEYSLTGGGGACAAGDRKVKSLFPRLADGQITIACEQQGVAPQARAICCRR